MQQALMYRAILLGASGLYGASLISRQKRKSQLARGRSWLIATPQVTDASITTTALLAILPLLWRFTVAVLFALLLSINAAITIDQSVALHVNLDKTPSPRRETWSA
jgi:hypothetical protein